MGNNIKKIYKDILSNQNLEDNIPGFLRIAADKYNTYASVRLALIYYTYYETYVDYSELWSDKVNEYIRKINNVIFDTIAQVTIDEEAEKYISQIDDIRKSVTAEMETLTFFVDLFELYEYVLNRVEYRFQDMEQIDDDEELARRVLRYIFDSEDNVIINDRIKEVIGQLPIRITKQKYFDYIRDSLNGLVGANDDVLEALIYMIRSCAALSISQDMNKTYPKLWDYKEKFEAVSLRDITEEEYEAATKALQEATAFLELETTAYYGLIEIINELYTILLCSTNKELHLVRPVNHREEALNIVHSTNQVFMMEKQESPSSEILSRFEIIEGIQEDMEYDMVGLDDLLYHIDNQHRGIVISLGKEKLLRSLLLSRDLHSGSLFIDLGNARLEKIVDRERVKIEADKLIEELKSKFQGSDRMIVRAIMAHTLDKLPVFFNTHTEIMEYVLYSLNKCTDMAEKYASIEIIEDFMEI